MNKTSKFLDDDLKYFRSIITIRNKDEEFVWTNNESNQYVSAFLLQHFLSGSLPFSVIEKTPYDPITTIKEIDFIKIETSNSPYIPEYHRINVIINA